MQCLNEYVARRANAEDQCTGRFWEGRFKSQALLDEKAVLSCMAYVDLNPIRAAMARTPETSDYTSIQERLGTAPISPQATSNSNGNKPPAKTLKMAELMPFSGNQKQSDKPECLPFLLTDYLELVDWTGRAIRDDKRGHVSAHLPPLLTRLGFSQKNWLHTCCHIEQHFGRAIGPVSKLSELCEKAGLKWLHGIRPCRKLYPSLASV